MKQLQDNPWDTVAERYPVGSKVHGKVRNLTDFGAFVEIEDGIDGLVHVSDITWAKKLKHPKELLKKDQEVDAIVTHIDPRWPATVAFDEGPDAERVGMLCRNAPAWRCRSRKGFAVY